MNSIPNQTKKVEEQRVHACNRGCTRSFARLCDLKRHISTHHLKREKLVSLNKSSIDVNQSNTPLSNHLKSNDIIAITTVMDSTKKVNKRKNSIDVNNASTPKAKQSTDVNTPTNCSLQIVKMPLTTLSKKYSFPPRATDINRSQEYQLPTRATDIYRTKEPEVSPKPSETNGFSQKMKESKEVIWSKLEEFKQLLDESATNAAPNNNERHKITNSSSSLKPKSTITKATPSGCIISPPKEINPPTPKLVQKAVIYNSPLEILKNYPQISIFPVQYPDHIRTKMAKTPIGPPNISISLIPKNNARSKQIMTVTTTITPVTAKQIQSLKMSTKEKPSTATIFPVPTISNKEATKSGLKMQAIIENKPNQSKHDTMIAQARLLTERSANVIKPQQPKSETNKPGPKSKANKDGTVKGKRGNDQVTLTISQGKATNQKSSIKEGLKSKNFRCPQCPSHFNSFDFLRYHISKLHPELTLPNNLVSM